jgi:DNA-binding FadR family transcriptional regulator
MTAKRESSLAERSFTPLQGQYLAFIRAYTLIHRAPPAERDMQMFFRVTAPSIHSMILTLESRGLITRTPGKPRSIRIVIPWNELPILQDPEEKAGGTA